MRIIVPIKQVPETGAVRMDEATGTMIREGVEAIVNPLDLYAIELAIRLRDAARAADANGGHEIVVISMGPPKADKALREAIAMGCDRGVLISDAAFAGSDTWATSYVLAAAIKKLVEVGPAGSFAERKVLRAQDAAPAEETRSQNPALPSGTCEPYLIICGERATDGDTGQVGPGIASFLDLPVVTYVSKVRSLGDGQIVVERLVEDGHEVLSMELPGVLTVVKEVGDPRLPTLRGKQRARQLEMPHWGHAELALPREKLGLNGSPTRVVRIHRPTVARQCEKLLAADEESAAVAVNRVVEILKQRNLL